MRLFYIDLALTFLIRDTLVQSFLDAQRIKLDNQETFFSRPIDYLYFFIVSKIRQDNPKSEDALKKIKRDTDKTTKGLYHPEDIEGEKQHEAEGFLNLVVSKFMIEKYSDMSSDQLIDKMFVWDEDAAHFPNRFKNDLLNLIESQKSKTAGVSISDLRKSEEEIDEVKTISLENFSGDIEDLNNSIEENESIEIVIAVIEKYKQTLSKKAKAQQKLCDFFISQLKSGNWGKDIQETMTKHM